MASERFVVSWCRCGPYAATLARIRTRQYGRVEWSGSRKWVSEGIQLRPGQEVELCEVDLCHQPGIATVIAAGRISAVREDGELLGLTIDVVPALQPAPLTIRRSKLVAPSDPNG